MRSLKLTWVVAATLLTCFNSCKQKDEKKEIIQPEVNVVVTGQKTVPVYKEYVGQTLGITDVDIRSRVDGWVTAMHFKEGDFVRKGQLLYTIDDLPIRNRVDAAEAKLAEAKTMQVRSKSDLDRVEPLTKMNALSQRDLDAARANYNASLSQVAAAEAQLRNAKVELGYTRILSPIAGTIGISQVMTGDYVNAGSLGKPLNTVSAVGDVRVRFPISETEYLDFRKRSGGSNEATRKLADVAVNLILGDGSIYQESGRLDLANRQIDPQTGSLLIQAIFANKDNLLRPGQYVKVRFQTDEYKDAILIPQQAVVQLQNLFQVYVVNDSSKIVPRTVQTGARVGSNWIITEGLKAGEKVAIVGNAAVNPKVPIKQIPMNWNYDSTSGK
jgi:membrane fusion protein, multidrug efflux system